MKTNYEALLDKEFLQQLDLYNHKETLARITALNYQEQPLERLEGKITQGSINVDGASSLRRSCSLTMIAENVDINEYLWGVKCKFNLEIGLYNFINSDYPDIIWFKQGIFVINTFNTSQNTNSYNISITGKDKMCLLNGNLSGSLNASIDFGVEEYYDKETNTTTYTDIPIKQIIKEAVHTYAGEPYHNIIINDLDEAAVELLEYKSEEPAYLLYSISDGLYTNITFDGTLKCYIDRGSALSETTLNGKGAGGVIEYLTRVDHIDSTNSKSTITLKTDRATANGRAKRYHVARIEYGQTIGYRLTDLTYAGELISKVGEALTSILDKIVSMLGNYEYYYDVNGRFIFQRKRVYINQTWNGFIKTSDDEYVDALAYTSAVTYNFINNEIVTSLSNSPVLSNLKNDYSVWGTRESITGAELPIHYRYAIDKKPTKYIDYAGEEHTTDDCDWRELIYLMAKDYYAHHDEDEFQINIAKNNPDMIGGTTGYEQYYTDMEGFWRQLYNLNPETEEEIEEFPSKYKGWCKTMYENPTGLNFWFDFLDEDSELGQFSVSRVGARAKNVSDKDVKSIYYREVPNLIFMLPNERERIDDLREATGYIPIYIRDTLKNAFKISAQGKSAKDVIDELVYQYSYCVDNITIQSVPIYYLEPNTRIFVTDEDTKINGEYIMTKFTIPLAHNGTMSITANKAPERLTLGSYKK